MKHVKPRENFLNEEFDWKNPIQSVKELIDKVRNIVPKSTINKFIEDNRDQVENVAKMLAGEDGNIDYNKATNFIKENMKKRNA